MVCATSNSEALRLLREPDGLKSIEMRLGTAMLSLTMSRRSTPCFCSSFDARVGAVELGVEVLEEGGRLVELVLVGAAHAHRDDRDPLLHRGVQLEQAVRQHVARLEEQQDVALLHLVEQLCQVGEVVRVEEDGRQLLEPARSAAPIAPRACSG